MPRGKKKAANGNGQKISYKLGKREGGSVTFVGVDGDFPKRLEKTLNKFGFEPGEGTEWLDETLPNGDDNYEELDNLASVVDVHITAISPKTKRGGPTYRVAIGGADEVSGKTLHEALIKAHRAWNRAGRVVVDRSLSAAIETAISK